MRHWQHARRAVCLVLAAGLLLSGAIGLGLRLDGDRRFPPLPDAAVLRPASLRHGLPPLTEEFVARVLGLPRASGPAGRDGAARAEAPAAAPRRTPAGRVVVRHGLDHDAVEHAYAVPAVPFTARAHTAGATRGPEDPEACSATGGSVWYRYTPDRDVALVASTTGSGYATALGVFEQRAGGLGPVGCDVDAGGNAEVPFDAHAGHAYLFQVSGPLGGGDLAFHLDRRGRTTRVSADEHGREADLPAVQPAISADARRVAFVSGARLTADDRNSFLDVYVRDRDTGLLTLASLGEDGIPADDHSDYPVLSGDGRYVAFYSRATNLAPGDTNGYDDVFLHDLTTRSTRRVSVASGGAQGWMPLTWLPPAVFFAHAGIEQSAAVSDDGRHVAFSTDLAGLVAGDRPACATSGAEDAWPVPALPEVTVPLDVPLVRCRDVFVHDTREGRTVRISVSPAGDPPNGDSSSVHMTPNGRHVLFASGASNLVAGDRNGTRDVFLHDRDADRDGVFDERGATETVLVSVSSAGAQGDGPSGGVSHRGHATVSADARYVAFNSTASNLVPGDGNGSSDVFLRDVVAGTTVMVSGARGAAVPGPDSAVEGGADHAFVSADGRYVAFRSTGAGLAGGESNVGAVFVYDRVTGTTERASVSSSGEPANGDAQEPTLSGDGRVVVFTSNADNLVADDDNRCGGLAQYQAGTGAGCDDVFVHELPDRR